MLLEHAAEQEDKYDYEYQFISIRILTTTCLVPMDKWTIWTKKSSIGFMAVSQSILNLFLNDLDMF